MDFRIADTFTDSLARLTGDEQKAVKTTAFDLQLDPSLPSLSYHKLDRAKDKSFWSVRASGDLRLIIHRMPESLLLCYVDHHDKAYAWAERRKRETHPTTGAAQLVEIRETVQEIIVPVYVEAAHPAALLFEHFADDVLLGYGVPTEWLADVRGANEDTLFGLTDHLPAEAAEALLELATGGKPRPPQVTPVASPFEHPDALRRFRVIGDVDELAQALDFPWEKWTVFLHPAQRELVERHYGGPAIWASGSFNCRSHGARSASTSAAAPRRCASTTAPRTRFGRRPIGCSASRSRTSTATWSHAVGRSPCSMARSRPLPS